MEQQPFGMEVWIVLDALHAGCCLHPFTSWMGMRSERRPKRTSLCDNEGCQKIHALTPTACCLFSSARRFPACGLVPCHAAGACNKYRHAWLCVT
jgi:hypothetical protein